MHDFSPTAIKFRYVELCKKIDFSFNLRNPSDARIKKECQDLLKKKNSLGDKQVLRNFLELAEDDDVFTSLKRIDPSKFKPIVNFLKNKTSEPRIETIDLVVWLLGAAADIANTGSDLSTKSPEEGKELQNNKLKRENQHEIGGDKDQQAEETKDKPTTPVILLINNEETKAAEPENPKDPTDIEIPTDNPNTSSQQSEELPRKKNKHIMLTVIIVLFTGFGIFLYWKDKIDRQTITKDEKCMYWTGDHYEAIACNLPTVTPKTDLNVQTLNRLKKITLADTLTKNSIGKVWYATINNEKEFFTDSGMHPVDTVKRLKPITSYIISKNVSYHRYLLTVLIWGICITIFIAILVVVAYKYRKRNKQSILNLQNRAK